MSFIIKSNSKHSTEVGKNCFNALSKIDLNARKTITFNNGLEFVNYLLLRKFLKMDTYYCDKRSTWQKGQVEKTLLTKIDDSSLIEIQNSFNKIPRKVLGYKTPFELFTKYLNCVDLRT